MPTPEPAGRSVVVCVRFSPREHAVARARARAAGLSVSAWLRRRVFAPHRRERPRG